MIAQTEPYFTTPEALANDTGWSERRIRKMARGLGACRVMGKNAAVVLLQSPTGLLYAWAPQTLRGWCNVPVAVVAPTVPDRAVMVPVFTVALAPTRHGGSPEYPRIARRS